MRVHLIASKCVRRVGVARLLCLTGLCIPGLSATLAYQDLGRSSVGIQTDQTVNIPATSAGPVTVSLQYSIDFSIGACTPNGNGCSLPVSFVPTRPGLRQDAVIVKDANGQVIEEVLLSGVGLGPLPVFSPALATLRALITPTGYPIVQALAAAPDGAILLLSNNVISRFTPATNNLSPVLSPPVNSGSTTPPSIEAIAVDATGSIYYVNSSLELHRLDAITQSDSVIATNVNTTQLAVAPSGTIFYPRGSQIFKIAANTSTPVIFAGNGTSGFAGDNGAATQAEFNTLGALALHLSGNLYVADLLNHRIRKISTSGIVSTIAGNGGTADAGDGGAATSASLSGLQGLAVDPAGNVYVSTYNYGMVRRIDAGDGLISTMAGATSVLDGDGAYKNPFFAVGVSATAQDISAGSIAIDTQGHLWIGTLMNSYQEALFEVSAAPVPLSFPFLVYGQTQTQPMSLLNAGTADLAPLSFQLAGQSAAFSPSSDCPSDLGAGRTCTLNVNFTAGAIASTVAAFNISDNAASSPQTIPLLGASGGLAPITQKLAAVPVGSSSSAPQSISVQFPGNAAGLSAALAYGNEFRLGTVSCSGTGTVACTVSVTFAPLHPGLRHDTVQFLDSTGAVIYQCFLSGTGQGPQWFVDMGATGTIPMPSNAVKLSAIDTEGNLYAIDLNASYGLGSRVYRFEKTTQQWSVIAGQAASAIDTGDGGPVANATLSYLNAVALDSAGNLFIAETFAVRRVDARSGIIRTIAQEGGDSIAVDQLGRVYIGNSTAGRVRRLDPAGGTIVTIASSGSSFSLFQVQAMAFDNDGNLLISDYPYLLKLDTNSGAITAGVSPCGASSIASDAAGNLYLSCGEISLVPAGGGTPRFVETGLVNINGPVLRDADGTFYTSNGTTLIPALPNPINLSAVVTLSSTWNTLLTNAGNAALAIGSVTLTATNTSAFSQTNTCDGQTLAPAQNCLIHSSFKASQAGTQTANLTISSSAGSLQTMLNGTGLQTSIYISPQSLAFGNVLTPIRLSQFVYIQNIGAHQFLLSDASISGPNASDFTVQSNCPSTLTAVNFCSLSVSFQPSAPGMRTAVLTLTDNAAGSPHTIPLSGTGYSSSAGGFALTPGNSINFGGSGLSMQTDGNLILYSSGTAVWNTNTGGQDCSGNQCQAVLQSAGNLVVYNGSTALWSSGTYGNPGARLVYSGELQIVSANGSILWTNAPQVFAGTLTLNQGAYVNFGAGTMVMQTDGNLVLYQSGSAVWNTGTYGQDCSAHQCQAVFQSDGNLVVYNGSAVLWSSGTYGMGATTLVYSAGAPHLQINSYTGSILWTAVTAFQAGNLTLVQGASVKLGSSNLVMQTDGNLVLYQNGTALWSSRTYGQSCGTNQCQTVFQSDGNLVVYEGSAPLWNSGTYGNPDAQLTYSDTGPTLKIISSDRRVLSSLR